MLVEKPGDKTPLGTH